MAKARTGRIIALSPNWASPVVARYEFKTEISVNRDGDEQRWGHRQSPRLQIGMTSLLAIDDQVRFQGDMAEGQNDVFYAPVPWRVAALDAPSGASTLTINAMPFWAVTDALVVVEDDTKQELATILSVSSPTITLTAPLSGSFATGAKVYLAQECLVEASVAARNPTDRVATINSQQLIKPAETPHPFASITPTQHNLVDVFDTKPNWSRPAEGTFFTERGLHDSGRGRLQSFDLEAYSKNTRKAQYSKVSASAVEDIVAFFALKKGRRGSFYAPTFIADMAAEVAQSSGSQALTVAGTDFFDAYDQHPIWNRVYVSVNGATQINDVSSMVTSSGNTVLTMANTWSFDIPQGTALSWCPLSRFATDTLAVNWLTSEVAEMALSFAAIRNIA